MGLNKAPYRLIQALTFLWPLHAFICSIVKNCAHFLLDRNTVSGSTKSQRLLGFFPDIPDRQGGHQHLHAVIDSNVGTADTMVKSRQFPGDPQQGQGDDPQRHAAGARVARFGLADGMGGGLVEAQAMFGHAVDLA